MKALKARRLKIFNSGRQKEDYNFAIEKLNNIICKNTVKKDGIY